MLVPEGVRGGHVGHRDRYFDAPRTRPMGAGPRSLCPAQGRQRVPVRDLALDGRDRPGDDGPRRDSRHHRPQTGPRRASPGGPAAAGGDRRRDRGGRRDRPRSGARRDRRARPGAGRGQGIDHPAPRGGGPRRRGDGRRRRRPRPEGRRTPDPGNEASEEVLLGRFTGVDLGAEESGRALLAPLLFRGDPLGVVVALDRIGDPGRFDDEDQRMLEAFAASAATGVATARSMAEERLQNTIDAAEQERSRWARELHDETLQALAVLRMRLSSALQGGDARGAREDRPGRCRADRRRDREAPRADHRAAARLARHDRPRGRPAGPGRAASAGGDHGGQLRLRSASR